jgi:hypothetical protein
MHRIPRRSATACAAASSPKSATGAKLSSRKMLRDGLPSVLHPWASTMSRKATCGCNAPALPMRISTCAP